jgi:hypothetical protein
MTAMLLFHVIKNIQTNFEYFSKIYYHESVQNPKLSGAPTSQFRTSAMLSLVSKKCKNICWDGLQWHNVRTKFRENRSNDTKVERGDTQIARR